MATTSGLSVANFAMHSTVESAQYCTTFPRDDLMLRGATGPRPRKQCIPHSLSFDGSRLLDARPTHVAKSQVRTQHVAAAVSTFEATFFILGALS